MLHIDQSKGMFVDYLLVNKASPEEARSLTYSPAECQQIINLSNLYPAGDGRIQGGQIDQSFRKVTRWKLPNDKNTDWIYDRICKSFLSANKSFWDFDVDFIEDLELIKYEYDSSSKIQDHYHRHSDFGGIFTKRKISYSALLSNENDYEGADLILHLEKDFVVPKEQGQVVMFPSFCLHTVTEVTKGTRWSLVTWISGRPLR